MTNLQVQKIRDNWKHGKTTVNATEKKLHKALNSGKASPSTEGDILILLAEIGRPY